MHKIIILLCLISVVKPSSTLSKIDSYLIESLNQNPTANILIEFVGRNTKVINRIEHQTFKTRTDRLNNLKRDLQNHANISQQNVQAFLKSQSISFRSFWISNQIIIRNANKELIETLAGFPEIEEIYEEGVIQLDLPTNGPVPERKRDSLAEWGIERIQAPEAWRITNGTGVVIGNIDSGVRASHESLRDNFRNPYGWMDPTDGGLIIPHDPRGHGTHTLGTAVGSNGIGVAPGAEWIACRGCGNGLFCERQDLLTCGEWMMCPTLPDWAQPDCSKVPNIVTCSWGGGRNQRWFDGVTEAWVAGGIIPIFSIGNGGPECGSVSSPGDSRRVIGVGSIDQQDTVSYTSSVGPAPDGRIKPELSAPGENVRSAWSDSDGSYRESSGTSMACPHVTGVTALLLSIKPDMTFGEVRQALLNGVDRNTTSCTCECDNISDDVFPNFHFGFGVVNALKVVESALHDK